MSETEQICGHCRFPIVRGETGVRHCGFFTSHSHQRCVEILNAEITRLRAEVDSKQAKIDALMLEFCPDEVTPEQAATWAENQRPVSDLPNGGFVQMVPDTERAALLWLLWHHQGASSTIGQTIRRWLGIRQFERIEDAVVAQCKNIEAMLSAATKPAERPLPLCGHTPKQATEAFEWLRDVATADGAPEAAGVALDLWHASCANDELRCELGADDCGPPRHQDSEGVDLCSRCWAEIDAAPKPAEGGE